MGNHTATRARGRSSGAGGGGSGARAAAGADVAALHERSARLQREQGLAREVKPGEQLDAIGRVEGGRMNAHAALDPHFLTTVYGEHQLGAAMSHQTMERLREAARNEGMRGPLPRSKPEMVSALTAHVTEGRYSADFGAGSKREAGAARTSTGPTPREREAEARAKAAESRAAQLERQLATLQAQHDALKARVEGGAKASGRGARASAAALPPLVPTGSMPRGYQVDPFSSANPHHLVQVYGRAQLERALRDYTVDSLKETAAKYEANAPGTKPTNRGHTDALIKYIAQRYDAGTPYPDEGINAGILGNQ